MFSLLAKAAEMIEQGESCVELNRYENGPVFEGPNRPAEPVGPVEDRPSRPAKPKKTSGRWDMLKKKLSSLMSEDEDTDDEQ